MKFNTFPNTIIDSKIGNLPVALYPNKMLTDKDGKNKLYAMTVVRGVCTLEDLVNDIVASGLNEEFSKEQILNLLNLVNNAKLARLAEAFTVDDGITRLLLRVKGSFESESDTFSTERHSIEISSSTISEANKYFEKLRPAIRQGNSKKPAITAVYDVRSKSGNMLTKGGFLEIKGVNIKICGENQDVGLYFVNTDDSSQTVKLAVEELGINASTRIACVVPQNLVSGSYRIKVVTQFMGGTNLFRKEPQDYVYGNFTVE